MAYYMEDYSAVSDYEYDKLARELADRMKKCAAVEQTEYYYVFYDYTGSTGFHLYYRLNDEDKEKLIDIHNRYFIQRRIKT